MPAREDFAVVPHPNGDFHVERFTDPVMNAFDQLAHAGVKNYGGLPALPTELKFTHIVAPKQSDAVEWCHKLGLNPGIAALGSVDQLHGVGPEGRIAFIHHGNESDENMLNEVRSRSERQSFSIGIIAL
jgi:hypothetical protein